MLRVQIRDASNSLLIKIEGRFNGDDAEYVQTTVARLNTSLDLVIDLTDVTFIDSSGEIVLSFLKRLGAVFVADNLYSLYICERLRLPLAVDGRPSRHRRSCNAATQPVELPSEPEVENPNASND